MTFEKHSGYFYAAFRILAGLLFLQHGLIKFGLLGKEPVALLSLMGLAAVIEVAGGVLITLGIFSRVVAGVCAIQMLVAYFMAHVPKGWHPLLNGGEPALLFFAAFLAILAHGSGKFALSKK